MTTDITSQAFPFNTVPPGSLGPGSTPIGAGHTFTGTYWPNSLMFQNCSSYLYWANSANSPAPESCSFTYNGSSV